MSAIKNEKEPRSAEPKGLKELFRLTQPKKSWLVIAFGASILSSLAGLGVPLFTQNLIDRSFSGISLGQGVLVIGLFILQALFSALTIYLLSYIGHHMVKIIREKLTTQSIHFPLNYFQIERPGELVSRTLNDTLLVKSFVSDSLPSFVSGVVTLVVAIAILLYMDWKMTLLIFLAVPIGAVVIIPVGKKIFELSKKTQDETADFSAEFGQVLASSALVKASNAEANAVQEINDGVNRLFSYGKREAKIQAVIQPIVSLVIMGLVMGIIAYGGYRVANGTLSAGTLIAFIMYLFQVMGPIVSFGTFFTDMQKVKGATERITVLLREPIEDLFQGETITVNGESLEFRQVSFRYNEDKVALEDINFTAMANQTTAFVGPSGSGKSTLFTLIEEFYQPEQGQIFIGDHPIADYSLSSWRRQIGYVQQESMLLSGSIRDNLTYGLNREVTDGELDHVMALACGTEIMQKLPLGYQSEVGERGAMLSGGERQRVAIARAFLRDPKILLLDEATASLDSQSEEVVQEALRNLMEGRTTLVIAHRLSTVVNADKIIFVEDGRITGQGTHQELLEHHSLYRTFASHQLTS